MIEALKCVDQIVVLGDMGETVGLDQLVEIAPVLGTRGADDQDDPRNAPKVRSFLTSAGVVGCVFAAKRAGLAVDGGLFTPAEDWAQKADALFGGECKVLLTGATHAPFMGTFDGRLVVNPGSLTVPVGGDKGAAGSFAKLTIDGKGVSAEIVFVGKPPPEPAAPAA
jgi:predicted phosphodiesterase